MEVKKTRSSSFSKKNRTKQRSDTVRKRLDGEAEQNLLFSSVEQNGEILDGRTKKR